MPHHARTLATTALACALLTACGGGEPGTPTTKTIVAQPLSLALRPGESERMRYVRGEGEASLWSPSTDLGSPWLDLSLAEACVPEAPDCAEVDVRAGVAGDAAGPRDGDWLTWPFTHDPASPLFLKWSYAPVNPFPATPATAPPVLRFAAGEQVSAAVDADGQVWVWGDTAHGATGTPHHGFRSLPQRVRFEPPLPPLVAIDVGLTSVDDGDGAIVVAIDETRHVWAWGSRALSVAQGIDDPVPPQAVAVGEGDVTAVAAGGYHALALRADGSVWAWGSNRSGQLGALDHPAGPVRVDGLPRIVAIAAGAHFSLALDADGDVWAWGSNAWGTIGIGKDETGRRESQWRTPRRLSLGIRATAIDAGPDYALALGSGGSLRAWGRNDRNQLGAESRETCLIGGEERACSAEALRVGRLDGVDSIAAGGDFALARRGDGRVWAWGANTHGQLGGLPGLGTLEPREVPRLAPALAIVAGGRHALAAPVEGACSVGDARAGMRLMAWGDNTYGERGDGTAVNGLWPTPVLTLGDDDRCAGATGRRLLVVMSGTATGRVSSDAEGLACSGPICWQTVPDGAAVTLSATPDGGAEMGDWRWDCAGAGAAATATLTLDAVRHCKLRFLAAGTATARVLTVNVEGEGWVRSEPAGIDCGEHCVAGFAPGQSVSLTAEAADGWRLARFTGSSGCADARVEMSSDRSCRAVFEPVATEEGVRLTVQRTGPGAPAGRVFSTQPGPAIDCGETCSARFPAGTIVALRPEVLAEGVFFSHFSGCSDTGSDVDETPLCFVRMDADRTIQADFE